MASICHWIDRYVLIFSFLVHFYSPTTTIFFINVCMHVYITLHHSMFRTLLATYQSSIDIDEYNFVWVIWVHPYKETFLIIIMMDTQKLCLNTLCSLYRQCALMPTETTFWKSVFYSNIEHFPFETTLNDSRQW